MSDLLDKISSYNIFNYLLPGALFVGAADLFTSYDFTHENVIITAFLIYFIGLVISRIGSLVIEPLILLSNAIKFASYEDFVAASKNDEKLDVLVEVNNMYRTLVSLLVCVFLFVIFTRIETEYPLIGRYAARGCGVGLLILFFASWAKQTNYIVRRVAKSKGGDAAPPKKPPEKKKP